MICDTSGSSPATAILRRPAAGSAAGEVRWGASQDDLVDRRAAAFDIEHEAADAPRLLCRSANLSTLSWSR